MSVHSWRELVYRRVRYCQRCGIKIERIGRSGRRNTFWVWTAPDGRAGTRSSNGDPMPDCSPGAMT